MNSKKYEILLVENNPGDIRIIQEIFKESKSNINLSIVNDGAETINRLKKENNYKNALRPDIIILDLNLPKKNGFEVLKEIKSNKELKRIPVIVLTTSEFEEDISNAYDLHANCYIKKPTDFEQFIEILKSIQGFWLNTVRLPST